MSKKGEIKEQINRNWWEKLKFLHSKEHVFYLIVIFFLFANIFLKFETKEQKGGNLTSRKFRSVCCFHLAQEMETQLISKNLENLLFLPVNKHKPFDYQKLAFIPIKNWKYKVESWNFSRKLIHLVPYYLMFLFHS